MFCSYDTRVKPKEVYKRYVSIELHYVNITVFGIRKEILCFKFFLDFTSFTGFFSMKKIQTVKRVDLLDVNLLMKAPTCIPKYEFI